MAEIESVLLREYVRVAPGANGEAVMALDARRPKQEGVLSFEEVPHGVKVFRKGALFTTVPWGIIKQVLYVYTEAALQAEEPTKPATPTAKAK